MTGDKRANVERAIEHAHASLRVRTRQADPANWAFVQANLAYALLQRIAGDRLENVARAIESARGALEIYTKEDNPWGWAQAHMNLASAYLVHAGQANYHEIALAIESLDDALSVYTPEAAPDDAIRLYVMLSEALLLKSDEDGEQSARRARSAVDQALSMLGAEPSEELGRALNTKGQLARRTRHPRSPSPSMRSTTRRRCGPPTSVRMNGRSFSTNWALRTSSPRVQAQSMMRRTRFEPSALTVITRSSHPAEWALIKSDMGDAHVVFGSRRRGSDIDNAIRVYEEALRALHPQKDAHTWGTIQCNLGEAYVNRSHGNRVSNIALGVAALERAVGALEQAGRQPGVRFGARELERSLPPRSSR